MKHHKFAKYVCLILCAAVMISSSPSLFGMNVFAATSGTTGACTWELDGTVLTISGNGRMGNYQPVSKSPWGGSITEVIINSGVTSIGDRAFQDCSSLTSVTIPDSVTSIGEFSFRGCTGLTSVTIPGSVKSIDLGAFYECTVLTSITITAGVTSIGNY